MVSQVNFSLWRTNPAKFWKIASWLLPTVGFGLIWVATRIMGVLPKILGDELIYSINARHLPPGESSVPNYLFNLVFGMTNSCGYGFYTCGKSINLLFLVGFAVFIYLTARLVAEPKYALLVGFLALVGPVSAYASYFTPDMMFYFGASVVIYFALRIQTPSALGSWALIGAGLGIVTLIKPHALFLLPPFIAYLVFLAVKGGRAKLVYGLLSSLLLVASTFAVKLSIGFAIAGQSGLSVFGGSYDSSAAGALSGAVGDSKESVDESVLQISQSGVLGTIGWQIAFHFAVWIIFAGLPLIVITVKTLRSLLPGMQISVDTRISVFLFFALITLVTVSAVFVALSGSFGEALQNRVMTRYYDYLTPFLPLVLLAPVDTLKFSKKTSWTVLVVSVVILAVALPNLSTSVPALFTDSSLVAAALQSKIPMWLLAAISISVTFVWLKKTETGIRVWLYVFAPAMLLLYAISSYLNMTVPSSFVGPYTTAARYAHDNLTTEQLSKLMVIGNTPQNTKAAQLWIDEPRATGLYGPPGSEIDLNSYPEETEFFLLVGDFSINGDGILLHREDSWVLIQNSTAEEIAILQAEQK